MYALLIIILVLVSICLIGVVLIQSGRGDGLSGAFGMGEGQAVFGNRAGDVLTKATSWFAIAFMVLCLLVTWQSKRAGDSILRGLSGGVRRAVGGRAPLMTLAEQERQAATATTNDVVEADLRPEKQETQQEEQSEQTNAVAQ
ncbi:MAG: preprotein translocase subunit SecG [bacterium]|nr:preprotein translocase subunit SecG [bacterium]